MKKFGLVLSIENFICKHSLNSPKLSLTLIFIFFLVGVYGLSTIQVEYDHRIWFRSNDPHLKEFDRFKDNFGNDESLILAIKAKDGIFTKQTIKDIQDLTDMFWQTPNLIAVDSLTNYVHVYSEQDEIIIEGFFDDELEITDEYVSKRRRDVDDIDEIQNFLISKDRKTTAIYGKFKLLENPIIAFTETIGHIQEKISDPKYKDYEFHLSGTAVLNRYFRETSTGDMKRVLPFVFALIALSLYFIFGTPLITLFCLIELFTVTVITMGFGALIGIKLSMIVSMVPCIISAIALADTVHIASSYRQFLYNHKQDHKSSLESALRKNIIPTFLTSVSTGLGFIGLFFSELQPLSNLGALSFMGIFAAWFTSLFLFTPLLYLFKPKMKKPADSNTWNATNYINHIDKFKLPYTFSIIAASCFAIFLLKDVEVNSDLLKYFKESNPLRVSNKFLKENIGGYTGIQVMIDSGENDGIKNPDFLRKVDLLQKDIAKVEGITKINSITNIVKKVNNILNQSETIPDSKEAVAQQLLLYELGSPPEKGPRKFVTSNFKELRLDVLWNISSSKESNMTIDKVFELIKKRGLEGKITGKAALMAGMDKYIIETFYASILIAVGLVALFMSITFNSLWLGIFSMVPNVIPPIWGLGLLGITGQSIDTGVVLITSVCLGIAVDDTIYFLNNYLKNLESGKNQKEVLIKVTQEAGRSLTITTIILVISFSCFAFSEFIPSINFGILSAIVLTFALYCDLVGLPALLLLKEKLTKKD